MYIFYKHLELENSYNKQYFYLINLLFKPHNIASGGNKNKTNNTQWK